MKKIPLLALLCVIALGSFLLLRQNTIPCEKIPEGSERDSCYRNWAVEHKEPLHCAKIVQNDMLTTGQPRDYCYIEIARKNGDETLCEYVSNQADTFGWNNRNACYTKVGVITKDLTLCDKIDQPDQKRTCVSSVQKVL